MHRRLLVIIMLGCSFVFAAGQTKSKKVNPKSGVEIPQIPRGSQAVTPEIVQYVAKNFGPEFSLIQRYPVLTGDLDGDGTEDAIIVVTRKDNPMLDEEDFQYKVIDPYDEYFGFGDPKVTTTFNAHDPDEIRYIAVVHDWKSATPKAKFVVINLPFEKLSITRIPVKKKKVTAIAAEELGGLNSAVYWDGKKYRWDAMSGMN